MNNKKSSESPNSSVTCVCLPLQAQVSFTPPVSAHHHPPTSPPHNGMNPILHTHSPNTAAPAFSIYAHRSGHAGGQ